MAKELRVLVIDEEVGTLTLSKGRINFIYDEAWRQGVDSFPLSLSMPLTASAHSGAPIENYLWNLLPDREQTLMEIARLYGVSYQNPFALVAKLGRDLPGAVQIVPPDEIEEASKREGVRLVSEAALADFLRRLVQSPSLNRINQDANHFSLAGAQPKKAILRISGRWYEHKGRTPTTHILKPPMQDLKASIENEHFCLRLASAIGLPTAKSEAIKISGEPAILVERYDRVRFEGVKRLPLAEGGGVIYRIHQEDFCQALSRHPREKYQNQGGPSMAEVMQVLEGSQEPSVDRERFMRACAFNFVILGIDAHGKNFSVLIDQAGYRLAPLYDIISAAAYDTHHYDKMAMKVGGEYRWRWIEKRHWERAARECRYSASAMIEHVHDMIVGVASHVPTVLEQCHKSGLKAPFLNELSSALIERCRALQEVYG